MMTPKVDIQTLYFEILCLNRVLVKIQHKILKRYNMTLSQYMILITIKNNSDSKILLNTLAKKIMKTPGNVTLIAKNLEKKKLVKRVVDQMDLRCTRLYLTPKCSIIIDEISVQRDKLLRDFFSPLTVPEKKQFHKLLHKLLNANFYEFL